MYNRFEGLRDVYVYNNHLTPERGDFWKTETEEPEKYISKAGSYF